MRPWVHKVSCLPVQLHSLAPCGVLGCAAAQCNVSMQSGDELQDLRLNT